MNRLSLLPLALAAALASSFATAAAPAAPAAPLVREVEGVSEYRLPNGLQVLLVPDASKPTVTVNVTYRVGSRMEGAGETGMAHLLEHMMFKSTKTHANVGAELSKRGMQFNGTTDFDRTNYYETFPADVAQLAWALKTEADRMTGANVLRKELDTEMTVVRNEMEAGENNPVGILIQKTHAAAFQWHSYGKDVIGARADVENVNIPHLQAFYRKFYQPDNATLIVAGAFDPAKTLAEIVRDFGPLKKPARTIEPTWTLEPVQDGEREVTLRRIGGQQAVFASYHAPALASPDYAAFEIIVSALADTPNGRLHKRLVEPGKATQTFGWASRNAEPGLLNLGAELKKDDKLDEVQKILVDTIEGMAGEPVTADELKRTQLQWSKGFDQVMADPERLCQTLSEAIAAGDWRLMFLLRDRVQAITLDQVNGVAKAWLKSSNRTLGRFIPTDAPDRAPPGLRVAADDALKAFKPQAAVATGEVFEATPANIDKRTQRYTLPSGLKVALMPKKTRGQTVELMLALHFGTEQSLRGQREVAGLVPAMLGMGTQKKTRAQIADAFDALKTDWRVQGGALWGAQAGMTTRHDTLVPALTLLAEVLREPAFPQAEFEQMVRQNLGGLEQAATDPGAVAGLALSRALHSYPADDVRFTPNVPESVEILKGLKRDALVAFHKSHWGANHGELAIVGDFDVPAVKAAIAQLFGDWKTAQPYVHVPQPASSVFGQRLTATLKDKPNAMALGSLPLQISDADTDYPALQVAAHVLGAGGFDSRLLTRLRQKEGLSYGVGAQLSASAYEPAGSISFYAIFAPENRAKVEAGFADEIARLVKDGITAEEFANARKAIQTERNTWRASDNSVAWAWSGLIERGRSFDWEAQKDAKLAALTLEQVNAAIRKWIVPARVDWSIAGDLDKVK